MIIKKKNIEQYYKIILIVSALLYCLPARFLIAVYTPSYLGWLALILFSIVVFLFIILSYLDLKAKYFHKFLKRFLLLLLVIGLSVLISFFTKRFFI